MNTALGASPAGVTEARLIEIVFPDHTNHLGTLFGGQALAWMDKAAFLAAAWIRLGRTEGRMQSRSDAIGLSTTRRSSPPPNIAAMSRRVNDQVTASA